MKEDLLDVLMYLFENYLYDEETAPAPDEEVLRKQLEQLGFPGVEIDKAFRWLEELQRRRLTDPAGVSTSGSMRIYTPQESQRLDQECRGFLLYLEQNSILDATNRELVIDRIMALESEVVTIEQLQWVILMVLFNQPGQEANYAWIHDLVYEDASSYLH